MVYCHLSIRIIGSIYINHFEAPTHLNYVGHNQKKDTHTLDFDVALVNLPDELPSCTVIF